MFDKPERTVVEPPFTPYPRNILSGEMTLLPRPPWFVTNRKQHVIGRLLTSFEIAELVENSPHLPERAFGISAVAAPPISNFMSELVGQDNQTREAARRSDETIEQARGQKARTGRACDSDARQPRLRPHEFARYRESSCSGVSLGILHYYFEDKIDLISYCVRLYKETFIAMLDAAMAAGNSRRRRHRWVCRRLGSAPSRNMRTRTGYGTTSGGRPCSTKLSIPSSTRSSGPSSMSWSGFSSVSILKL